MWAVVDVETTGLYWRSVDRVVEIAVVRLDTEGREVDTWTTLVDPDRDVGATHIHGITATDLRGAPSFEQIAPDLLWRLSGRVPVGHNVRFDLAFLTNELGRLGLDLSDVEGVCTMGMSESAGVGRALPECCSSLGVPLANHHSALEDARATAEIFRQLAADFDLCRPQQLPDWPAPPCAAPVRHRTDPYVPRAVPGAASFARSVGVPDGLRLDPGVAVAYLDMLDRVLEDRVVDIDEASALVDAARDWGIGTDEANQLHRAYLAETWKLARADGVVTPAELRDIEVLAGLLGVPAAEDYTFDHVARARRSVLRDWEGRTVCFTGTSLARVDGTRLQKADLQRFAEEAGMVVRGSVSPSLDLLVVGDAATRSGKAKKADLLGVRKMYDVAFLRALGVDCDAGRDEYVNPC